MEEPENNQAFEYEDDDELIPWPEEGDKLFTSASDWQFNAWLKRNGKDWHPYVEGYRRAADLLVEHIINDYRYDVDYLVYPITFLYRQHLELRLKAMILDSNQLRDRECKLPLTHNILSLWIQCREILKELWPEEPDIELDAIEECIKEFCNIDGNSMAFRYPVDKNGDSSHSNTPNLINVRHLAHTMTKIANLLDGAHTAIQEYINFKQEMNEYY